MEDYYTSLAQWKKQVEELEQEAEAQKQAEELKRQAEAQRRAAEEEERKKRPVNNTLPGQQGTPGWQTKHAPPASGVQKRDFVESKDVPVQGTPNSGNEEKTRDLQNSLNLNSPSQSDPSNQKPLSQVAIPPAPTKPQTHLEYVTQRIQKEHIPSGFVTLNDRRYILRYASLTYPETSPFS
jgi:mannosyl-oligosaccharide alpha-1,2-mannosidase